MTEWYRLGWILAMLALPGVHVNQYFFMSRGALSHMAARKHRVSVIEHGHRGWQQ
jgi:hypothetical protein